MNIIKSLASLTAMAALSLALGTAAAQTVNAALNETIQMVPLASGTLLETTFYKPDGNGPFPLVIVNHGRYSGEPKDQERMRPSNAARYFLQRGYAVIAPMRQGLSKSGGYYVGRGCDIDRLGRQQAEDVAGVLDYVTKQPWADKSRILVIGQSHGGLTTLAFGTQNYPGVKGLVNFAGGSKNSECNSWEFELAKTVGAYAKETKVPSLWFYGDNDSFFGSVYRSMHEQYQAAGGRATLVPVGKFEVDAHYLFVVPAGNKVWEPEVTKFLSSVGLPDAPIAQFAKFGAAPDTVVGPKSDFAALADVDKVPFLRFMGRRGYKTFLDFPKPRAFAVGPDGAAGWAHGDRAVERALDFCSKNTKKECKLYAVDDDVVYKE